MDKKVTFPLRPWLLSSWVLCSSDPVGVIGFGDIFVVLNPGGLNVTGISRYKWIVIFS